MYTHTQQFLLTFVIFDHLFAVLHSFQNNSHTRVGYFLTMCATILDIICGINYKPFVNFLDRLNRLVRLLRNVAETTDNLECFFYNNEVDKSHLFSYVRFVYLVTNFKSQKISRAMRKEEKLRILQQKDLEHPAGSSALPPSQPVPGPSTSYSTSTSSAAPPHQNAKSIYNKPPHRLSYLTLRRNHGERRLYDHESRII